MELTMPRGLACALLTMLLLGVLGARAVAAEACDAPAPGTTIKRPSELLPPNAAAFAGVWRGQWPVRVRDETLSYCAKFYISVVDGHEAKVEHCNGSRPEVHLTPRCSTFEGTIDGNRLSFIDVAGNTISLTLADVGGMLAEWSSRSSHALTQFVRDE
jgi:hypothetical protein